MAMANVNDLAGRLEELMRDPESEAFPVNFDSTLAQFAEVDDPSAIGILLRFFDERVDEEVLFTLVQAVEHFDAETYVRELLNGLPDLRRHSPYWARTLVLRVLNSPTHLAVLSSLVPKLSPEAAEALRRTLEDLIMESPQFEDRSRALLARLS
jgi:hypothetical protein